MAVHESAGHLADAADLIDVDALRAAYYDLRPDPGVPAQQVAFGTSGHRGTSTARSFNEAHIVAITEAIRRYRAAQGVDGPLFIGKDTHALSEQAYRTALEVLIAGGVTVKADPQGAATPTPVVSHAILSHNDKRTNNLADGIVITPSHNPPPDGGFKYDPPSGGPADQSATTWIQDEANRLLAGGWEQVARIPFERAITSELVQDSDFLGDYVGGLPTVVDIDLIRGAGLKIGVDPLGGASLDYWHAIAARHHLDLDIVNNAVDPTFGFVPRDWDGKIRMDPSSPYATAGLLGMAGRFEVATANDPDADRFGIVVPSGLVNPNHYLAVSIAYLFGLFGDSGRAWPASTGIGKTLVSTSMIDRVAAALGRRLVETPVGFKWFVDGLMDGTLGFGGEESAGASFARRQGGAWSTDKDGLIMALLAMEMTARTGRNPAQLYTELTDRFGAPFYRRVDAVATPAQKAALKRLSPAQVAATELAGEPITAVLTEAPGNGAAIGGVKIVTGVGWVAMRPSGTEDVSKVYAESFRSEEHLGRILDDAQRIVATALAGV